MEAHKKQAEFVRSAKREPINLLYSGETLTCDTAKECAEKLLYFTVLGYRIPQHAIDYLMEED